MKAYRERRDAGLKAKPRPGRPRKLTKQQERTVLSWFNKPATKFGFPTELWTAARVAKLIHQKWEVKFHPRYISAWLAQRRVTPQKPRRQPRERNDEAIQRWLDHDWPLIQNAPFPSVRIWY